MIIAVALWLGRRRLARRQLPMRGSSSRSALIAGASIAAVELPTAAPYFAVIAAIVAASASVPQEIGLLALYNVALVLPLLAILIVLMLAGEPADQWLQRGGAWLQRLAGGFGRPASPRRERLDRARRQGPRQAAGGIRRRRSAHAPRRSRPQSSTAPSRSDGRGRRARHSSPLPAASSPPARRYSQRAGPR
jgi:Sap, sulfolipid-1-addressing protein